MRTLKYILHRLGNRIIDLIGISIGVIGLIIAYTATAEVINVVVQVPPALLPSQLIELIYELGTKCLESCFEE